MKKLSLFLVALTMILFSCKPEIEKPTVVTKSVGEVTKTSAKVVGQVAADGGADVTERGVCWNTAPAPEVIDYRTKDAEGGLGTYELDVTNLKDNTQYYVRAYATNEKGVSYGEELTFTTKKEIELPEVKTAAVEDITESEAVSGGEVVSDGGAEVTARGICWSTKQNPTIEDDKTTDGTGVGTFTSEMTDLEADTKYYVRAYATNEKGTAYGEEVSFTTEEVEEPEDPETPEQPEDPETPEQPEDPEQPEQPVGPAVTTAEVTEITVNSAVCGGEVISGGDAVIVARGVCWNTTGTPTIGDNKTTNGEGIGSYTSNMTGLEHGTTYYVRAYATNEVGTAYGEEVSFTTIEKLLPTVTTATEVTDITVSSAVCGGEVTFDGNVAVTAKGICWNTTGTPTIGDNKTTNGEGIGSYTSNMTGLEHGTTYYVRAYATNEVGTAYGDELSFTTLEEEINEIDGHEYVDLGLSVKWATCNVGATTPEEYGDYFAWGETTTKSSYIDGFSKTYGLSYSELRSQGCIDSEGKLTAQYDAARANWGGTWRMPTKAEYNELLNNCTWTWTTQNGVNGYKVKGPNGNSIFLPAAGYRDGSSLYLAGGRGYYWSSTPSYDYFNAYSLVFNSSNHLMDYYGRPYGQSVRPVSGGGFEGPAAQYASVETAEVTEITFSSAVCGGEVTFDGNVSVTARGICWSTSQNPTIEDNKTSNGSGVGSYTSYMTDLQRGTTYYVRAYATNEVGTAYGEEVSFTTLERNANGHEYVDLGLSVKWATCNVGATSPEEYGDYFAWGETTTKETYTGDNCPTYGLSISQLQTQGYIDSEGNLNPQYDAARANWGGTWRMPTKAEMQELIDNCTWTWTTQNGVNGYSVEGPNGNSIFLPAAGYRDGSSLRDAGSDGDYWSSTPFENNDNYAYYLYFHSSYHGMFGNYGYRYFGQSVRPILE